MAKVASHSGDGELEDLCRALAAEHQGLVLYGPGTTTQRILAHLGVDGTLLGVDAVDAGRLVGADLGERGLLDLLAGRTARLVLGVVGGQGSLLGRGNQQLSPEVLRRIGLDRIEIVAAADKLLELDPAALHVDTGDPTLDRQLVGYRRVRVGPRRMLMMNVST
jgi:predicted polyphosphate/ATP-dependent NAD kinase